MDRDLPALILALRGLRSGSISRPRADDPRVAALRSLQGEPDADEYGGPPDADYDDKAATPSADEIRRRQDADEGYITDSLGEIDDADLTPTQRVELEQGYRLPQAPGLREDELRLRNGRIEAIDANLGHPHGAPVDPNENVRLRDGRHMSYRDAMGDAATRSTMGMADPYARGAQRPNLAIEIKTARGR